MVNEHDDKFEGQEEGEYHFTDDSLNYEDIENEPPRAAEPEVKKQKENPLTKLTQPRRMLISIAAFVGLIFIVYKMLAPSATTPTDFAPNAVSKPMTNLTPKTPKPLVPVVQASTQTAQQPSAAPPSPTAEQINQVTAPPPPGLSFNAAPNVAPVTQPAQPVQASVAPAPSPSIAASPAQPPAPPRMMSPVATTIATVAQPELTQSQRSVPPVVPQQQAMVTPAPMNPPPVNAEITSDQSKIITEKLAALEEENAKLVNMMQSQFAQKISEVQTQSNESQERVQALNKRISNMEASMNKMAQLLQEEGVVTKGPPPPSSSVGGLPAIPPPKPIEMKTIYTVQAIIPGRAWLKSDSGETVTVAEGDLLKDYGRVTKIDPYDGVVNIDTGTKIIVLSYGGE